MQGLKWAYLNMDDLHLHESHQKFDSHPNWAGFLVQMLLFAHGRGIAQRASNINMLTLTQWCASAITGETPTGFQAMIWL